MRAIVLLAMLPLGIFGTDIRTSVRTHRTLAPEPAPATKPVRVIPIEANTFAARWQVASALPVPEVRVVTVAVKREVTEVEHPPPRPRPVVEQAVSERAPREHNICTRHRMHKVWVSDKRWRCRK